MKRLAAAVAALFTLTACNPPTLEGGGWAWDPDPAHPITVDNRWGLDLSAVWRWNAAAGTQILANYSPGDPNGVYADIVFSPLTPICAYGNCNDRRAMWVERIRTGPYVSHCVIHFDPTYPAQTGNWMAFDALTIDHEIGHCLDYPDVVPPTDYQGIMSYYAFWDQGWRNTHWFGGDDQAMLARDGYGP